LGWWLETSGDAIYGTRPWIVHRGITGDGLPIRYTMSQNSVHAVVLGDVRTSRVELDVMLDAGAEVELEGQLGRLDWDPSPTGVRVMLPEELDHRLAAALRLAPSSAVHPRGSDGHNS
jgi:hypothetical protein